MREIAQQACLERATSNPQGNLYRFPSDPHTPAVPDITFQPGYKVRKHHINIM
jgi:hypothetical protein